MSDLLERLRAAVADRYEIESEIGRGGMATVYLAQDLKHRRKVAIKVLHPELAAAVGPDRFLREIESVASLTHPHVLPLHDSGEADGLLFYVMPYVEGESLRQRLDRERRLPVGEAIRIAQEVAEALDHAHRHGLIHRDIKPGNILLEEGHAVVTDFGVVRAISDPGGQKVTATGMAIGTPAYMSQEQAAGEEVDERSDIYALGCVLYEMLAGEPPLLGPTPQATAARRLTDRHTSLSVLRDDVSPGLSQAVDKALAPAPADRYETPLGLVEATTRALEASARESVFRQAVGTLIGAAVSLLVLTRALVLLLGLPDWLWEGAIVLIAAGVPALLLIEHQVWGKRRRWLTHHGALAASGAALLIVLLSGGSYLASRTLGVGPFATPISRGQLDSHAGLVLSDFVPVGVDADLADAVTELLRTDLMQSSVIHTVPPADVRRALERMQRSRERLDRETAVELAQREGLTAVLSGELRLVGGRYLLLAALTTAADGDVLVSVRETAADSTDLIAAAERLSRKLRHQSGENLRTVRASQPLPQVTTASLPALQAYATGVRRVDQLGDNRRGLPHLEEAVAIDSAFAMAYRKLSATLSNLGRMAEAGEAADQAYEFRHRLPELERLHVEGHYHRIHGDLRSAEGAYLRVTELDPLNSLAWTRLADIRLTQQRFDEAEAFGLRALEAGCETMTCYWNAMDAAVAQRRFSAAESVLARMAPGPNATHLRAEFLFAKRDFRAAEALLREDSIFLERTAWRRMLAVNVLAQGRVEGFNRLWGERSSLWPIFLDFRYRGDSVRTSREFDALLDGVGGDSLPAELRNTWLICSVLSELGRVSEARERLIEWKALNPPDPRLPAYVDGCEGAIALAEGRLDSATGAFSRWQAAPWVAGAENWYTKGLVETAGVLDLLGRSDSAAVLYQKALDLPAFGATFYEGSWYPFALLRLGELYDDLGQHDRAIECYDMFVDLWRDADPELQPRVNAARAALIRLRG